MKKLIGLLLAATLVSAALVGCSGSTAEGDITKTEVAGTTGGAPAPTTGTTPTGTTDNPAGNTESQAASSGGGANPSGPGPNGSGTPPVPKPGDTAGN